MHVLFHSQARGHMINCFFVWFDSLRPSQQFFSYVVMGLLGLNKYEARINVSCSRTQRSDASEAGTHNPLCPPLPSDQDQLCFRWNYMLTTWMLHINRIKIGKLQKMFSMTFGLICFSRKKAFFLLYCKDILLVLWWYWLKSHRLTDCLRDANCFSHCSHLPPFLIYLD